MFLKWHANALILTVRINGLDVVSVFLLFSTGIISHFFKNKKTAKNNIRKVALHHHHPVHIFSPPCGEMTYLWSACSSSRLSGHSLFKYWFANFWRAWKQGSETKRRDDLSPLTPWHISWSVNHHAAKAHRQGCDDTHGLNPAQIKQNKKMGGDFSQPHKDSTFTDLICFQATVRYLSQWLQHCSILDRLIYLLPRT